MAQKKSLIKQYKYLLDLHEYPEHPEVKKFIGEHKNNTEFQGKIAELNRLFKVLKDVRKGL